MAKQIKTQNSKLITLLQSQPELAGKLLEAIGTGRFFITVTCQKKTSATDKNDLQHYFCRRQFIKNDVVPSLRHIAADFAAKEMPQAEIESQGWH